MTQFGKILRQLKADNSGASVIEFAIIAPTLVGAMVGVVQVGMGMQSYNAVRNVTADTARYALVEYQKGETPTNTQIRTEAYSIARGAPYLLNDNSLRIFVWTPSTQRVDGATEKRILVSYTLPVVIPVFDFAAPTITHSRPIFVVS